MWPFHLDDVSEPEMKCWNEIDHFLSFTRLEKKGFINPSPKKQPSKSGELSTYL